MTAPDGPPPTMLCQNCGNPIRFDNRLPPNQSPTGWIHGRWREAPDWQGKRCPGRLTGAEPRTEETTEGTAPLQQHDYDEEKR